MQKLGYNQKLYNADEVLAKIADVVPFFKGVSREKLGNLGWQWPVQEHMVNMVTGHGKDEETMCAEYKVSSVEVQKISNKFKTEVVVEKKQAEVTST